MKNKQRSPAWIDRFLQWRLPDEQFEEVQGDMHELYRQWVVEMGERKANWLYLLNAFTFLRSLPNSKTSNKSTIHQYRQANSFAMIRNYITIASRNLLRQKAYSFINIGGLSIGMAVAMLISLWMYDELSFNTYHQNYHQIAEVKENEILQQGIETFASLPLPVSEELRNKYGDDFTYVVASTWEWEKVVSYEDKIFTRKGIFTQADFPQMMSLRMLEGASTGLNDPSTILISQSLAKVLFSNTSPVGKTIQLGKENSLQVRGVYEDLPHKSSFKDIAFIGSLNLVVSREAVMNNWQSSSFQILVQLQPNSSFENASLKIKNVLSEHIKDATKPELFLHPMSKWHLYEEFKDGKNAGGRIVYVWLFGSIALFVLLLACINFMNLTTARSEKRAKEVGIRKAIGSMRGQLIAQFYAESLVVALLAFILSLLLIGVALPYFNDIAGKQLSILWTNPPFWICGLLYTLFTGLIAGSYPALYLSAFNPVKVLKGTFRLGTYSGAFLRRTLVVVQFTVSVTLIIGTMIVYEQIQFGKNRSTGYSGEGLINISLGTQEVGQQYDALRNDLLASGAVKDIALSSSPITNIFSSANNLDWQGKDPNLQALFGTISVTPGFGKVVGWQLKEGREFSEDFTTDSSAFMFNEAAAKLIGIENLVGQTIRWHDKNWQVIGVVKDMVMDSPFEPAMPTVFMMNKQERPFNIIHLKLNRQMGIRAALAKTESIFKKYNPAAPFEYTFADEEYARKFAAEERIGKLAAAFALLAIFVSCLGLFGLASFMAERRRKEISIRKVLGASVFHVWQLLSKEFVVLILLSFVIATPLALYAISNWLNNYAYKIAISPWIFILSGAGALLITLLTVSFQSIKAALVNPAKILRNE